MMFLADAADGHAPLSLSTLRGRIAAINRVHVEAGHPAPGDDPAMAMLMRGLGPIPFSYGRCGSSEGAGGVARRRGGRV